jgi:hypothetical protein
MTTDGTTHRHIRTATGQPRALADHTRPQLSQVQIHGPGDADYLDSAPWNRAIPSHPRAVIRAHHANDVVAAVRYASSRGLRLAVRSTGHGAVPVTGADLLVHTASMTECTVDPTTRSARVGAGTDWQRVIDLTAPHGLMPLAGSAPHVGVIGYLTGGGIGPMARTFGVSSDQVRAIDVVTGTGRLLRASATEHPDLFWGLRGGKATLGIVTAIEIDLIPLTNFYGGSLWYSAADTRSALHVWRQLCTTLPDQATTSAAIMRLPAAPGVPAPLAGQQTLAVRVAWIGDPTAAETHLRPLRSDVAPIVDDVLTRPTTQLGRVHSDPVAPMPVHSRSALLHSLPEPAIDRLLDVATDTASQTIVELRQLGGAIARPPRHASAVCHREAAFQLFTSAAPRRGSNPDDDAQQILAAVADWTSHGLLPNFASSDDRHQIDRCYDAPTLHQLQTIADRYDPGHVLHTGQVARSA